ncbi:MAG: hypothetical protein H6619_05440 [Deltaproteobacteria bacterium]|nr:hypothetical protein [Deltaproteobacteria bacterium]
MARVTELDIVFDKTILGGQMSAEGEASHSLRVRREAGGKIFVRSSTQNIDGLQGVKSLFSTETEGGDLVWHQSNLDMLEKLQRLLQSQIEKVELALRSDPDAEFIDLESADGGAEAGDNTAPELPPKEECKSPGTIVEDDPDESTMPGTRRDGKVLAQMPVRGQKTEPGEFPALEPTWVDDMGTPEQLARIRQVEFGELIRDEQLFPKGTKLFDRNGMPVTADTNAHNALEWKFDRFRGAGAGLVSRRRTEGAGRGRKRK